MALQAAVAEPPPVLVSNLWPVSVQPDDPPDPPDAPPEVPPTMSTLVTHETQELPAESVAMIVLFTARGGAESVAMNLLAEQPAPLQLTKTAAAPNGSMLEAPEAVTSVTVSDPRASALLSTRIPSTATTAEPFQYESCLVENPVCRMSRARRSVADRTVPWSSATRVCVW